MSVLSDPRVQMGYFHHADGAMYVAVDDFTDPDKVHVEIGFLNEVDGKKSECYHDSHRFEFHAGGFPITSGSQEITR